MTPPPIELSAQQLDALIERIKTRNLLETDYQSLEAMGETINVLSHSVDEKAASIKRLLKMIFGPTSEKTATVAKKRKPTSGNTKPKANGKKKGHGRNGAADYTGAEKISVPHGQLKHKDPCPACLKGKVYLCKKPKTLIRVTGTSPLTASVYEMEKLRCNLCGEIFTAKAPENIGTEKYDAAAGAMIALLKYGSGFPFYRLENLQASVGIPLPAATQWDIVRDLYWHAYPAFCELVKQGADGKVIHNDDTSMKILSLINEDRSSKRKGVFTSGMVSVADDHKIGLFFTGRQHAGENLANLLTMRETGIGPPIQMCDALSRNLPKDFKTLLANCLSHGRRRFVDVYDNFPDECNHVLKVLAKVYKYDAAAREQNLTDDQRLDLHQSKSGPLMDKLKEWFDVQFEEKKVEPNSGLGQAIKYMLNHWNELTLFLRQPGAPLDNNICERALKKAILNRKNALFYKTERGARVGDLYMSLIHTCELCNANPFDYLVALRENSSEVKCHPDRWMPWNYKEAVSEVKS
jgi:transposase